MKNNSGEIILGLLIGLGIGIAILTVESSNRAQEIANSTGMATSPLEVIAGEPGQSALTIFGPAVAGAGLGWVIDELGNDSSNDSGNSRDNTISVGGENNNISVSIVGDQDNDSTNEDNDSDSYNR